MSSIKDKIKEKVTDTKDKVAGVAEKGKDKVAGVAEKGKDRVAGVAEKGKDNVKSESYEEGGPGTERGRKDDPLTQYRSKEPMTPAKIKEHEPTAVKREMTEKIVEPGKQVPNPEAAKEIARRSGMAKGTAGADETGDEYEQGAAGTNK
jgi:hypothetical protein